MWTPDESCFVTAEQKAAEAQAGLLAAYKSAFDAHLDAVAQQRQYDNRLTVPAYFASTNPRWAAEAETYIAWRDACLVQMFDRLASVQDGSIVPPTIEQFIADMPAIDWPDLSLSG